MRGERKVSFEHGPRRANADLKQPDRKNFGILGMIPENREMNLGARSARKDPAGDLGHLHRPHP
jgi:hypothetical protein